MLVHLSGKFGWLLLLACASLVAHAYFIYNSASYSGTFTLQQQVPRALSWRRHFDGTFFYFLTGNHTNSRNTATYIEAVKSDDTDLRSATSSGATFQSKEVGAYEENNIAGSIDSQTQKSSHPFRSKSTEDAVSLSKDGDELENVIHLSSNENTVSYDGMDAESNSAEVNEGENVEEQQEGLSESEILDGSGSGVLDIHHSLPEVHNSLNSHPNCSQPSLFRSWKNGIVTQIGHPLKRDCRRLRQSPAQEVKKSKLSSQLKVWKSKSPWESFAMKFKQMSCDEIREEFSNNFYISQVEKDFPLAYIFVVYTNAGQVLRLLKSIYRPHNLYCIHPDARQGKGFKEFFTKVAQCLDNVFVVSKPVKVYYGHISITDAQLHCMHDLEQFPQSRWRYVINLCGREIPIKTNREIVESLQRLRGYTGLNLYPLPVSFWNKRFRYKYRLQENGSFSVTQEKQAKPPKGIKLYKSMNFMAASRDFVHFLLHDPVAIALHDYLTTVYAPEEHFYSSLYAYPQAIGGRPPPALLERFDMPVVDNFIWLSTSFQKHHVTDFCPGHRVVHCICILSASDLEKIEKFGVRSRRPVFFFNKYFLEWDPTPMDCMEERLVQANMEEYRRDCMPNDNKEIINSSPIL